MLHQAGSGVLGPVFRAFDLRHDRVVAIKAFTLPLALDQVARLTDALRRLAATQASTSSVILPVDAGIEGTTPFVVMPAASGETLDVIIRRDAPVPPEHALPVLGAIAQLIDLVAATGMEHGGLHPRDIFVTAEGLVSVTGFGIRRALEAAGITAAPRRPYAAPETYQSTWDRRADMYSFGAIAHELLTRRPPAGPGEQDGEFTADLAAERRVQLRRVLALAIAEQPGDRYDTAAACVEAIATAGVGFAASRVELAAGASVGQQDTDELQTSGLAPPDSEFDLEAAGSSVETLPPAHSAGSEPEGPAPRSGLPGARPEVARLTLVGARQRPRRVAVVAGLVAVGALGAVAGHLAVRAFRNGQPTPATSSGASVAVDETEVVMDKSAASPDVAADVRPVPASAGAENVSTEVSVGRLRIRSEPAGALVTVDGKRLGQTPAELTAVPFGSHQVQVARAGYVPRVARVTLAADVPEQLLSFVLRPGLRAATEVAGALEITSRPRGARVVVDGRFVGHAPLRVPQLKPGIYTVTLELAGHQSYTDRVGVTAGGLSTLTPTLHTLTR